MFTEEHKNTLLNLIEENNQIIESKINTVDSNLKKKKCWEEIICKQFNREYPLLNLKTNQLKDVYKRMKMVARKNATTRKKEMRKTGGGASATGSAIDERLERIVPSLTAEIVNGYDDDAEEIGDIAEIGEADEAEESMTMEENHPCREPRLKRAAWADEVKKMAREEHQAKMRIFALKEKVLRRKLTTRDRG